MAYDVAEKDERVVGLNLLHCRLGVQWHIHNSECIESWCSWHRATRISRCTVELQCLWTEEVSVGAHLLHLLAVGATEHCLESITHSTDSPF